LSNIQVTNNNTTKSKTIILKNTTQNNNINVYAKGNEENQQHSTVTTKIKRTNIGKEKDSDDESVTYNN
jgi:hypothetical protein